DRGTAAPDPDVVDGHGLTVCAGTSRIAIVDSRGDRFLDMVSILASGGAVRLRDGAQAEARDARANGIARDPEDRRRPRDVPARARQGITQTPALEVVHVEVSRAVWRVDEDLRRRAESKGSHGNDGVRAQEHGSLDQAVQLPNVPRPAIRTE